MTKHLVLAEILKWAIDNDIEITVRKFELPEGLKDQIELVMSKNGKTSEIKLLNWEELDSAFIRQMAEKAAFELCLTRLVLS